MLRNLISKCLQLLEQIRQAPVNTFLQLIYNADNDLDSKLPPLKQQRVKAQPDMSVNSHEGIATIPGKSFDQYNGC